MRWQGIAGGAQGVVDMLSPERDDTVRSLLETGGFVLEEIMRNSGYSLEVHFCARRLTLHHPGSAASCWQE